uniref:Uncharacterized protein n=1 Tax=Anguilla anguilla TaxID=7936 RepID=A0A0E9TPF8_ANGAN
MQKQWALVFCALHHNCTSLERSYP